MADWSTLAPPDRRELLLAAADASGRPAAVLEKDAWVVWTLRWIGNSPWSGDLVFKGGTSLSKVYRAIERFSEDVDLTYDIRKLVTAVQEEAPDPLPASRSQAKKWSETARVQLEAWLDGSLAPALSRDADEIGLRVAHQDDVVWLHYATALESRQDYLPASVKLELGGRATGLPFVERRVTCDIADVLPDAANLLPVANVRAMAAERKFWEKATAAHVYCCQERAPAERFARHWYDLASMWRAGLLETAIADSELALKVVEHKQMFFAPSASHGAVDYEDCTAGRIILRPDANRAARLRDDYLEMLGAGYLWGWVPDWEELMDVVGDIESTVNEAMARGRD